MGTKKGRKGRVVRYIIEGRKSGRWVQIGQPIADQMKASLTLDAAMESGDWEDARILVVNKDSQVVRIIG